MVLYPVFSTGRAPKGTLLCFIYHSCTVDMEASDLVMNTSFVINADLFSLSLLRECDNVICYFHKAQSHKPKMVDMFLISSGCSDFHRTLILLIIFLF